MAEYCTLADVKAQLVDTLGSSVDPTYDAQLNALRSSASRAIDGYIGQQDNYFYPSTDTVVRYYDGNRDFELQIDDFLSISELAVAQSGGMASTDYSIYSSTSYYFHPYNAANNGKPYKKIVLDTLNADDISFYGYPKGVRVTGIFGYSLTPPEDVKQACVALVVRHFMRAKNAFQDAGANPAMGQMFYVTEVDPDVKMLLKKYVMENL